MKTRAFLIPFFVLISFFSWSQPDSTMSHVSYFVSLHSGALLGKKGHGTFFSTSAIQGIRYKRISLGVGVGYDAYPEWRTVPLFVSGGYDVVRSNGGAWFIQMNTGYSVAWSSVVDEEQFTISKAGGYLFHPVVGYRIAREKLRVYFSAGYKFQDLSYEQTPRSRIWGWPGTSRVLMTRDTRRLSFQIGIGLQ